MFILGRAMRRKLIILLIIITFVTQSIAIGYVLMLDAIKSVNASFTCTSKESSLRGTAACRSYVDGEIGNDLTDKPQLEEELHEAGYVFSSQKANIVFCKSRFTGAFSFRRGSVILNIAPSLCRTLGKKLEQDGKAEVLFAFRESSEQEIYNAFKEYITQGGNIEERFRSQAITVSTNFKKILFIAPYGDTYGKKLKKILPHKGLESMAHYLIRQLENVDARVYDPNLGSREDLYELVKSETFDIIGFSYMGVVIKKNAEIMGAVKFFSPSSIIIAGGEEVKSLPDSIFESLPFDLLVKGQGEAPVRAIVEKFDRKTSRENFLGSLEDVTNLVIYTGGNVLKSSEVETDRGIDPIAYLEDISFNAPDATHNKVYPARREGSETFPVRFDQIGRNPLRLKISDRCEGDCVFCHTQKQRTFPEPIESIINKISTSRERGYDSVHFEDNDFLFDEELVRELCDAIISRGLQGIPKFFKTRTDNIKPQLLQRLAKAGFKMVAFGIESFNDSILLQMQKGVTSQQNEEAIKQVLSANIRPVMHLMLFSPWETERSLLETIKTALSYAERGACIRATSILNLGFDSQSFLERYPDLVEHETVNYPGMKGDFRYPIRGKILDPQIKLLREAAIELTEELRAQPDIPAQCKDSLAVNPLILFKAIYKHLERPPEEIDRIDMLIKRVIEAELGTLNIKFSPSLGVYSKCGIVNLNSADIERVRKTNEYVEEHVERILEEWKKRRRKGIRGILDLVTGKKGIRRGKFEKGKNYGKKDAELPSALYYFGNLDVLQAEHAINFSGSTNMSGTGGRVVQALAQVAAERKWLLVDGHSFGSELFSAIGALDKGGRVVAVLGDGIFLNEDELLPRFLQPVRSLVERGMLNNGGCFLSEYNEEPINKENRRQRMLDRDRLLSGLSDVIFIVESSRDSGTVDTARQAYLQGKKIVVFNWDCLDENVIHSDRYGGYKTTKGEDIQSEGNKQLVEEGIAEWFPEEGLQLKTSTIEELQLMFKKRLAELTGSKASSAGLNLEVKEHTGPIDSRGVSEQKVVPTFFIFPQEEFNSTLAIDSAA